MKIGIGGAFVLAMVLHGALLAVLAVNVSLDKPKKPEDKVGKIIHATIINMPPAKGNPNGQVQDIKRPQIVDTQKAAQEALAKQKAEEEAKKKAMEEAKRKAELEKQVEAQKKAEAERQKALALKKKAEEEAKKKAEEAKKKAELEAKKKAEEEAKKKAELEAKKKAEEEAKKKAELEAKKKAEEETKKKAELEAKKKAEEEAKRKAELEAKQKAQAQAANNIEDDILGELNGLEHGQGLGSGNGSDESAAYGIKVQQLIEQNWRIDPSMNGKKVIVTVSVNDDGTIYNERCQGDARVCASAISTLRLIGLLPRPPQGCRDCNTIVITMTPKL